MTNELVSIVMCTYNGERFLDEQIQSIMEQTYEHIELILVDDNSTDDTLTIAKVWERRYPDKVRVYRNIENIGYNANFANALTYAKGEYIAISDQDDIWLPNKIKTQLYYLKQHNDIVLVHHMEEKLMNATIQKEEYPLIQWAIDYEGNDFRCFVLINVIAGHQMVFKKELLEALYPFPPGDCYVYDWWIATVATLKGKIGYIREVLAYHRLHENNTWFNKDRSSKLKDKYSFYDSFLYKRLPYLQKLSLGKKNNAFIERLSKIVTLKKGKRRLVKLFFFLFKYRKNIFPVKSKYKILEEYAYCKRCITFCNK